MKRLSILAVYLGVLLPVVQAQTTIVLQPDSAAGKDAMINFNQPNTNYGNYLDFIATAWTNSGVPHLLRSFIDFDISMIPPNATILSAYLSLFSNPQSYNYQLHSSLSGSNISELHRITSPWSEHTVTWNSQPTTDTVGKVVLPQSVSSTQNYLNIDITQHIQFKHANPASHYGFMFRLVTESMYRSMIFASSDHPDPTLRPKLEITYLDSASAITHCPTYSFHTQHICLRDSIFLQGAYRKTEGLYFDTLLNSNNHDSIVVTALYVSDPVIASVSFSICDGDSIFIDSAWRKQSGVYSEFFTSQYGCDSIVHSVLNVIVIHNTISISGSTLISNQPNASYQWIDCNGYTPVPGATQQSFQPSANGNYAVIVTKDGCMAFSPCVAVTTIKVQNPSGGDHGVKVFPNPTSGRLHLELDKGYRYANVSVVSMKGSNLLSFNLNNSESHEIDLASLPAGLYLLRFILDDKAFTLPLVIE